MSTAHLAIAGVPLSVEYTSINDKYAVINRVATDDGIDNIIKLLAPDVLNSIRVACVKNARAEMEFLRRIQEQEGSEA